jgi:hypothetical protein
MPTGYCTVPDVRRVLQETGFSGAAAEDNNRAVVDAITSQAEWLRSKTDRHWYEPNGLSEDDQDLVPTAAKSRGGEEQDIPSTPHPQHSTLLQADRGRYPLKMNGPYTRIGLDKHAVSSLTTVKVRDSSGEYTDWVADSSKTEGEDYTLYVEPGSTSSPSYLDLHVGSLPAMNHYDNAVRVSYDYGLDGLSRTVRRATAMKAGAQLLAPDDDSALGIPDNANLVAAETKVQALERQAEELLEETYQ